MRRVFGERKWTLGGREKGKRVSGDPIRWHSDSGKSGGFLCKVEKKPYYIKSEDQKAGIVDRPESRERERGRRKDERERTDDQMPLKRDDLIKLVAYELGVDTQEKVEKIPG